jgi:hypothetical protein
MHVSCTVDAWYHESGEKGWSLGFPHFALSQLRGVPRRYAARKTLGELISVRSSQHSTVLELFCPSGDNLSEGRELRDLSEQLDLLPIILGASLLSLICAIVKLIHALLTSTYGHHYLDDHQGKSNTAQHERDTRLSLQASLGLSSTHAICFSITNTHEKRQTPHVVT